MSDKAIYARVSTVDQDCAVQLAGLKELMQRYGWPEYSVYMEKLSGKEGNKRPELDRLMEDARAKQIDTVMVWKMDRFGRSTLDTLTNIKLLDAYKVRFLCPSMGIDTDNHNPTAKFMLTIFAAVAELERGFINERTQGGFTAYQIAYAAGPAAFARFIHNRNHHSKSGKDLPVGRPKKIFHRGRIAGMLEKGMSRRAIAKELGVSDTHIRRMLKQT